MACSQRSILSQIENATNATAVEGVGDLLYVGSPGIGLSVYDLSNPNTPVLLGVGAIDSRFEDIAITGGKAFIADGSDGMLVVDVSDPTSPAPLGSLASPGVVRVVEQWNGYAVMGDLVGQVTIVDVSDPESPVAAAEIFTASTVRDIAITGNTLVVVTSSGLQLYDLTTVGTPILLGTFDMEGQKITVDASGDTAFVLRSDDFLEVVDISDPAAVEMLGQVQLPADMRQVRSFGDRVLVSSFDSGVIAVDVSTPAQPVIVGSIGLPSAHRIGALADKALIVRQNTVNLVDPTMIELWDLSLVDSIGSVLSVTVTNEIAYVTGFLSGTVAVDVSDPANPVAMGGISHFGFGFGVAQKNGLVFVADGVPGLVVMDFTDPVNPALLAQISSLGPIIDLAFAGNTLMAIVQPLNGEPVSLLMLDVSEPANPVVVAQMNSPDWEGTRIYLEGDRLVVPHLNQALALYDISTPTSPVLLGTWDQPMDAHAVAMSGDLIFIARNDFLTDYLSILDFTDPGSPVLVAEKTLFDGAKDIAIFGDYLLYAGVDQYHLWDVSNVEAPKDIAEVSRGDNGGGQIARSGSIAYLSEGDAGLRIFDISDCPPCLPDLNADGLLDFFDLQLFLNWYAAGDLRADLVPDGVLDFFDVQAYLGLFAAGCP